MPTATFRLEQLVLVMSNASKGVEHPERSSTAAGKQCSHVQPRAATWQTGGRFSRSHTDTFLCDPAGPLLALYSRGKRTCSNFITQTGDDQMATSWRVGEGGPHPSSGTPLGE